MHVQIKHSSAHLATRLSQSLYFDWHDNNKANIKQYSQLCTLLATDYPKYG